MEQIPEDLSEFELRMLGTMHRYRNTVLYIAVMVTIILILLVLERL